MANETPAQDLNGRSGNGNKSNPLVLKCDYREEELEHWPRPSELDLARLAVQLASGGQMEAKQAVQMAWEVYWESCRTLQADYKEVEAYLAHEAAMESEPCEADYLVWESVPQPKQYPVGYRELELLLMPQLKGRTIERAKRMRSFLFLDYIAGPRQMQPKESGRPPTCLTAAELDELREASKQELDDLHEQLRATPLGERDYLHFAHRFLAWDRMRTRLTNSMVRSAAARQAWAKRRANKKAKRGARPKYAQLREIIELPKKVA